MANDTTWQRLVLAAALTILVLPVPTVAQGTVDATQPGVVRLPLLMISAGAGAAWAPELGDTGTAAPAQSIALEYLIGRNFVIEGEAVHWARDWALSFPGQSFPVTGGQVSFRTGASAGTMQGWTYSANLFYRTGPSRFSFFAGGGIGASDYSSNQVTTLQDCVAPAYMTPSPCQPSEWSHTATDFQAQAVAGLDVRLTRSLLAYASLQAGLTEGANLSVTGGVRYVAVSRPAVRVKPRQPAPGPVPEPAPNRLTDATGKKVRVTLTDGSRETVTLVSSSAADLVGSRGGEDIRYPLDRVLIVETVHHKTAWGALVGGCAGALLVLPAMSDSESWALAPLVTGGIGAGVGALIGAAIDKMSAPRHLVYAAPEPTARVVPMLTPTRAGVGVILQW